MKKIRILLAFLLLSAVLFGCAAPEKRSNASVPADTDLEFWIGENVDGVDFSSFEEQTGWVGARAYYGTGYIPGTDADGQQVKPDRYVCYTVSSYPDYSSKTKHITAIKIADPDVKLYGLNLRSSREEITSKMESLGYTADTSNDLCPAYNREKVTVVFTEDYINIRIEVTNVEGIIY